MEMEMESGKKRCNKGEGQRLHIVRMRLDREGGVQHGRRKERAGGRLVSSDALPRSVLNVLNSKHAACSTTYEWLNLESGCPR